MIFEHNPNAALIINIKITSVSYFLFDCSVYYLFLTVQKISKIRAQNKYKNQLFKLNNNYNQQRKLLITAIYFMYKN